MERGGVMEYGDTRVNSSLTPIAVHLDDGRFWAECPDPACVGWSAGANDWRTMFDLIAERHSTPDGGVLHGWWAVEPFSMTWNEMTD